MKLTDQEKKEMLDIKYQETKENIKLKITEILTGIENINIDLTPK